MKSFIFQRNQTRFLGFALLFWCGVGVSCSSLKPGMTYLEVDAMKGAKAQPKTLWRIQATGLISDLDVASETGEILLGTIGDPERPGSVRSLSLWSPDGKKVWENALPFPARQQSISSDGRRVAVGDYENQLIAMDQSGRQTWKVDAHCQPRFLVDGTLILCLRDDDPKTDVPFEVLSARGQVLFRPDFVADGLFARVTPDGKSFAVALRGGEVTLYHVSPGKSKKGAHDVQSYWRKKFAGEVIDVDLNLSREGAGVVAVYVWVEGKRQVHLLAESGKAIAPILNLQGAPMQVALRRSDRLEGSADPVGVFTYSNGPQGQWVSLFEVKQKSTAVRAEEWPTEWIEVWKRGIRWAADYSTEIVPTQEGGVLMGWERKLPSIRMSEIARFDRRGELEWLLPIESSVGAYLFRFGVSPEGQTLYVATDDGVLSAHPIISLDKK